MENIEPISPEEESIIQNQILHNRHVRIIEKIDMLESEINGISSVMRDSITHLSLKLDKIIIETDRRFDRIDSYGIWVKYIVYLWAACILFQTIYRAFA
jgi:hypothetical protein